MNPHEILNQIKKQKALEAAMILYITAPDSISDSKLFELLQCIELLSNDLSKEQVEAIKAKVERHFEGGE